MKFLGVIALFLTATNALACDLTLVAPAKSALKNPVQAKVALTGDVLTASFSVSAPSLNAKKTLGPKEFPYMFDVVEMFVTVSETGFPYYEFEVSPFNQTFQVKIVKGKPFQEGVDLGLVSSTSIVPGGWTAEMKVRLTPLGWDGDPGRIRGNLYAILERAPKRSFWSSFLPKAKKANFHQPRFFRPLLRCG
jgi:hypothetical protein